MVSEELLHVAESIVVTLRLVKQALMVARTCDRGHYLMVAQRVRG